MREVPALSPTETAVLHAVARYRYINVELLHRVVDATRQTIRDATHRLRVFGLLGGTGPKLHKSDPADPEAKREFGKPSLFWVSENGARYLNDQRRTDPGVPYVVGSTRRPREGTEDPHRLAVVAIHIAFRAWAETTGRAGVSFLCDFEPGYRGKGKATAVPWPPPKHGKQRFYMPDGFARFRLAPEGAEQLMVIEFERGGSGHSLSDFFRFKLDGIRRAAEVDLVERFKQEPGKPELPAAPYLVVFATEKMRRDALRDWPDPAAPVWGRFFIKTLTEIEAEGADFSRGWWRVGGGQRDIYATHR